MARILFLHERSSKLGHLTRELQKKGHRIYEAAPVFTDYTSTLPIAKAEIVVVDAGERAPPALEAAEHAVTSKHSKVRALLILNGPPSLVEALATKLKGVETTPATPDTLLERIASLT